MAFRTFGGKEQCVAFVQTGNTNPCFNTRLTTSNVAASPAVCFSSSLNQELTVSESNAPRQHLVFVFSEHFEKKQKHTIRYLMRVCAVVEKNKHCREHATHCGEEKRRVADLVFCVGVRARFKKSNHDGKIVFVRRNVKRSHSVLSMCVHISTSLTI